MWTILWQEAGADRWDRLEDKQEVFELLKELKDNPDICEGDVWVFYPGADYYAQDFNQIVNFFGLDDMWTEEENKNGKEN